MAILNFTAMPLETNEGLIATSPSTMLDYALAYTKIGWFVFPVWGAKDGQCKCRRACKSPGKHPVESIAPRGQDDATLDPEKIRKMWGQFPEAGIACYMLPSGLITIDLDPRNGSEFTMDAIEAKNGPLVSEVMQFTQGGGEHRIFKLTTDLQMPGKLGAGVDVKRNGYIVLAPTQGVQGQYEWEASSDPLEGVIPSPLPDSVRDLATAQQPRPQATFSGAARFVSPEQVLELKEALGYLASDDYHQWVNVGNALKAAGQQGYGLWDTWSQSSEKYDAAEQGKKWRSFKEGALNLESIFKMAQDAGWVNPLSNAATAREGKLQQLVAEADQVKQYATVAAPVMEYEGFPVPLLDEVCTWIESTQGIAHSTATQMAALSLASLAASRLYVSESGDAANIYQLISAQTVGELRPIHNAVAQIVSESGLRRMLREQRFSSPLAYYKTLMRAPATLYLSSDWGALAAFARRQPSGVAEQVLHLISTGFGQKDILLDNAEELGLKAAAGLSDDMPVIRNPALSLLALASASVLTNAFSASEIGRGSVEQFVFHSGIVNLADDPVPAATPAWLITQMRRVRRLPAGSTHEMDLASIFNGNAELIPNQTVVKFAALPSSYYPAFDLLAAGVRQARPLTMASRTNFRKLSTTLAVWANPEAPVASLPIMTWAAAFIAARLAEALSALRLLGGSEDGKVSLYQDVLTAVTESKTDGVVVSDILHSVYRFRSLSKEKRLEIVSQLIDDEQVIEAKGKNGKGKRLFAAQYLRVNDVNDVNDVGDVIW